MRVPRRYLVYDPQCLSARLRGSRRAETLRGRLCGGNGWRLPPDWHQKPQCERRPRQEMTSNGSRDSTIGSPSSRAWLPRGDRLLVGQSNGDWLGDLGERLGHLHWRPDDRRRQCWDRGELRDVGWLGDGHDDRNIRKLGGEQRLDRRPFVRNDHRWDRRFRMPNEHSSQRGLPDSRLRGSLDFLRGSQPRRAQHRG